METIYDNILAEINVLLARQQQLSNNKLLLNSKVVAQLRVLINDVNLSKSMDPTANNVSCIMRIHSAVLSELVPLLESLKEQKENIALPKYLCSRITKMTDQYAAQLLEAEALTPKK